jgi:hypothetical protein
MAYTNEHSLATLGKVILGRLENDGHIEFNPVKRDDVRNLFLGEMRRYVLSEAALSEIVRNELASKADSISEQDITETEAFKIRKRALKSQYEDHQVAGFYLKCSLKELSERLGNFLLKTPVIEEVFADDATLRKLIMDSISKFDESKVS